MKDNKSPLFLLLTMLVIIILVIIAYRISQGFRQETLDQNRGEQPDQSDIIDNTFITTAISENKKPKDINLYSFSADTEPFVVATRLNYSIDPDQIMIYTKWYYLETVSESHFATKEVEKVNGDYLVSYLYLIDLTSGMKSRAILEDTFPIGDYRVDWYIGDETAASTDFFVSTQ